MKKKNSSIKKEPISCKYRLMRVEKVFILLFVIFMGCHSRHVIRKKVDDFKCEILDSKKKSECEILHLLSDTLSWENGSLEVECVNSTVFDILAHINLVGTKQKVYAA
jgi:hypothetical protein